MKILIRKEKQEDWELVEAAGYAAETELQKLLAESPSLISLEEIRPGTQPLIAAVREVSLPGSGHTDILAFNAGGDIVVVECKLAANQEIKRKVIAQVLEYGAYLWNMSYEELNERVSLRANKNLVELVGEAAGDPEWNEETFRTAVEENLSRGNFVLVIAVDEMNDELNRTMRFLNTCGNPEFSFAVLEMRRFHKTQTEILVPHLHGAISQAQEKRERSSRKQWTEQEYFTVVEARLTPEIASVIKKLYRFTQERADRVWFGTGVENGSFTFHYLLNGKTVSIFSVYTNGDITLNFGWLIRQIDINLVSKLHSSLVEIEPFAHIPPEFNRWVTVKIDDMFEAHLSQFMEVVRGFGRRVKGL